MGGEAAAGLSAAFKARYVARGFTQRQGVDYFQTFSPTPKITTLRVLLHVAAQHDYELHSLDFSTAFLQGSLHEEIWLRHPPGFTGEHASRPVTPVRSSRDVRPRPLPVPNMHFMALCPSSVPLRVLLLSPPASSLPHVPDPESDLVRSASLNVTRLLAIVVTHPSFESFAASTLVAELVDFVALCRLDYATILVFYFSCPPSVGGKLALGCDNLEDRQFELEFLASAAPHLTSMLLCLDPDALDIPTPHSYACVITGPYSSQW
ncbi:unnamed protein product [Closterium sp. NIES-53]